MPRARSRLILWLCPIPLAAVRARQLLGAQRQRAVRPLPHGQLAAQQRRHRLRPVRIGICDLAARSCRVHGEFLLPALRDSFQCAPLCRTLFPCLCCLIVLGACVVWCWLLLLCVTSSFWVLLTDLLFDSGCRHVWLLHALRCLDSRCMPLCGSFFAPFSH